MATELGVEDYIDPTNEELDAHIIALDTDYEVKGNVAMSTTSFEDARVSEIDFEDGKVVLSSYDRELDEDREFEF